MENLNYNQNNLANNSTIVFNLKINLFFFNK